MELKAKYIGGRCVDLSDVQGVKLFVFRLAAAQWGLFVTSDDYKLRINVVAHFVAYAESISLPYTMRRDRDGDYRFEWDDVRCTSVEQARSEVLRGLGSDGLKRATVEVLP